MYRLSTRQILTLILLSAVFSAITVVATLNTLSRLRLTDENVSAQSQKSVLTDPSVATDERNNIEVYRAIAPGVAFITSTSSGRNFSDSDERQGAGSGSIIDAQGHILTNEHVVARAQGLTVFIGGDRKYPATVVGRDPDTDLAVIKINAPRSELTVVPLGDSNSLVVGQKVLAIGNPFGLDRTLTTGVISGLQRPIRARNGRLIEGAIQTDASINPGNSGGPLLDSRGRLIGINSQILSSSGGSNGVGFAVPVNIAKRVVPQLINNGYVTRPRLGIRTRSIASLRGQVRLPVSQGVIIIDTLPGSAAAAAGLRGLSENEEGALGDIITAIDGEGVSDTDDLTRILDRRKVGDVIQVQILRDNRRLSVPVRLLPERR